MSRETAKQLKRKRELTREAYRRNKDSGICAQTGCSCRKVVPPHVYCPKCLVQKNARTRSRKAQLRQEARAC